MNKLTNYIQEALVKKNTTTIQHDEYVDLGLPSGVKWATCNLGADEPEEYGLYFAWGETEGFEFIDDRNFDKDTYTYRENTTILSLKDDAAHVMLGGKWRMPTFSELKELKDNCEFNLKTVNGIKGYTLVSKINNNSIFIPFAGACQNSNLYMKNAALYLWSSEQHKMHTNDAYIMYCDSYRFCLTISDKFYGLTIRPVFK